MLTPFSKNLNIFPQIRTRQFFGFFSDHETQNYPGPLAYYNNLDKFKSQFSIGNLLNSKKGD